MGRLATYRYYNMDQIVGQALATYRRRGERGVVPRVSEESREAGSSLDRAVAAPDSTGASAMA